ncbi:MAG: ParA family protein [Clostridiales bacterium]|nr:ParA family protein [Clostridiales bacterium]
MKKISFFSYKGGAGRSTLAINVVPYLADKLGATPETPLILVDMDIDSCGITFYFDIQNHKYIDDYSVQSLFGSNGSIPTDDDDTPIQEHRLFGHLCPVGDWFDKDPRTILCLPAKPDAQLGAGSNYDSPELLSKMNEFVRLCDEYNCCGILFDSAVGDQLTAIGSNNCADDIVCVMRPTKQFREGTDRFLNNLDRHVEDKKIIVVPNVVPTEPLSLEDRDGVHSYPKYAKEKIIESFNDNLDRGNNRYDMSMLDGDLFGVPKIDRFMWQEGILRTVKSGLTQLEVVALKRYEHIAEIICKD